MKIGFCAIWKNKLSEYHANKDDEIDTTLKIRECFNKANDLGIKIHGLHNIRWSSDNQYFTYWECPKFEVLEIIISDLEKAGDFKFAKSKHYVGNELYSFSLGRKDVLKTNLSLGSILFIGLKKNLVNSKPQIFCEVLEKLLKDNKLTNNYPLIQDGEKIKFAYLKKQNTVGGEVIAILNQLPPELKLQDYIDYDKQFEKSFIEPMKSVMGAAGWQTEHISSLENFFG